MPLYTAVLREAEYFGVATLAEWIREKKYIHSVRITPSIELEQVSDCRTGLRPFWGDTEKEFEPGTLSTASNSGKSTTLWKRLLVQKIEFILRFVSWSFLRKHILKFLTQESL